MLIKSNDGRVLRSGIESGIEWVVRQGPLSVNGYAQIPVSHPWRNITDIQFAGDPTDVHGGITYGMDAQGWIGFDTAHYGDQVDEYLLGAEGRIWTVEDVAAEARSLATQIAEASDGH